MTDASLVLAAVRRGLDAAAQQATAADQKTVVLGRDWTVEGFEDYGMDGRRAEHVGFWSPAHVLAVVGSLRTICDGAEAQLADHGPDEVTGNCAGWGHASFAMRPEDCWDRKRALSVIAGLAAVWAPTTEEGE